MIQIPGQQGSKFLILTAWISLNSSHHHHQQNQQDDNDNGQKNKLVISFFYFMTPDHAYLLSSGNNMELNNSL
jgi:hypothetical protein